MEQRERENLGFPLRCEFVDGALQFRVSINTIKWLVENHPVLVDVENCGPVIEQPITVRYPVTFTKDLIKKINEEAEDGSTILTDMLDRAILDAIADGAEGVIFAYDPPDDLDDDDFLYC